MVDGIGRVRSPASTRQRDRTNRW
ncbi:unnamed protein product [Ectocarpus sp. CCAP 1310/34]|nr:unnamed protein product [Ectocarpus sp. CCAP 1310/34]